MKRRVWKKNNRRIGKKLTRLKALKELFKLGGSISQGICIKNVQSHIDKLEDKIRSKRK